MIMRSAPPLVLRAEVSVWGQTKSRHGSVTLNLTALDRLQELAESTAERAREHGLAYTAPHAQGVADLLRYLGGGGATEQLAELLELEGGEWP